MKGLQTIILGQLKNVLITKSKRKLLFPPHASLNGTLRDGPFNTKPDNDNLNPTPHKKYPVQLLMNGAELQYKLVTLPAPKSLFSYWHYKKVIKQQLTLEFGPQYLSRATRISKFSFKNKQQYILAAIPPLNEKPNLPILSSGLLPLESQDLGSFLFSKMQLSEPPLIFLVSLLESDGLCTIVSNRGGFTFHKVSPISTQLPTKEMSKVIEKEISQTIKNFQKKSSETAESTSIILISPPGILEQFPEEIEKMTVYKFSPYEVGQYLDKTLNIEPNGLYADAIHGQWFSRKKRPFLDILAQNSPKIRCLRLAPSFIKWITLFLIGVGICYCFLNLLTLTKARQTLASATSESEQLHLRLKNGQPVSEKNFSQAQTAKTILKSYQEETKTIVSPLPILTILAKEVSKVWHLDKLSWTSDQKFSLDLQATRSFSKRTQALASFSEVVQRVKGNVPWNFFSTPKLPFDSGNTQLFSGKGSSRGQIEFTIGDK